jgi:hypothetical protein
VIALQNLLDRRPQIVCFLCGLDRQRKSLLASGSNDSITESATTRNTVENTASA